MSKHQEGDLASKNHWTHFIISATKSIFLTMDGTNSLIVSWTEVIFDQTDKLSVTPMCQSLVPLNKLQFAILPPSHLFRTNSSVTGLGTKMILQNHLCVKSLSPLGGKKIEEHLPIIQLQCPTWSNFIQQSFDLRMFISKDPGHFARQRIATIGFLHCRWPREMWEWRGIPVHHKPPNQLSSLLS